MTTVLPDITYLDIFLVSLFFFFVGILFILFCAFIQYSYFQVVEHVTRYHCLLCDSFFEADSIEERCPCCYPKEV